MKSTTVETKPGCSTDGDPAFTLGACVLVGGVKPGRLRYVGGVHFVGGKWCGIELDDADGLHDGVVDGVRYFTCRDGHGIFAPRHRVSLRPHARWSALPGSPDVRMRALRKPTAISALSYSAEDGDVDRLLRVGSPRHGHQASLDMTSAARAAAAGRPQSALLTDDDLEAPAADPARKRSSLVTGRIVASNTPKASPKKVTFLDEIITGKERGVPCVRTDVHGTDGSPHWEASAIGMDAAHVEGKVKVGHETDQRRPRGLDEYHAENITRVNSEARTAVMRVYDLDEGSPSRKTPRTDGHRLWEGHSAYVHGDHLDVEVSNMLTADQEELSLSSDSIEANEIDDDFAAYGLASVARTRVGDAFQRPACKSPKTRIDKALSDLESFAGIQKSASDDRQTSASISDAVDCDVATLSATRASFELARTALTQYADLIRAAQESSSVVRRSWTPPAARRTLPVLGSSSAAGHHTEPAAKDCGGDDRVRRSPESAAADGGSSSGSVEDVDFETFDGEELDSIGDAMIDSIDGSSVQSEDSIAMLPHLSDVDDDDLVESGRSVNEEDRQTTATDDADELTLRTRDRDNANVDEQTVANKNDEVDVNLLNDVNNVVSCRQLAFSQTQPFPDSGGTEESLVVEISDNNVATITTGYILRQSTTVGDGRPMSLISSTSSTDTGA